MTIALARAVDQLDDLEPVPGLTTRAVRTVLRRLAQLAQADGTFRHGVAGSTLAELTSYSLATVRRVERYLVERGYLERVRVGGGRVSTRWRLILDRVAPGHGSRPAVTPEPSPPDTALARGQGSTGKIYGGRFAPRPSSTPTPPRWRAGVRVEVCDDHGGPAGRLADGRPRCPQCRHSWRT